MGSTKAVMYPRHMVYLETNLSMVYVQNSRIQARSGGKPRFHLGWQLELPWKKLWNVSSFAHRNLRSISAAAHRERWPRTGSLPARSSCSHDSGCRFTTRQAGKHPSFQSNRKPNARAPQQYLHIPFPPHLGDGTWDCMQQALVAHAFTRVQAQGLQNP